MTCHYSNLNHVNYAILSTQPFYHYIIHRSVYTSNQNVTIVENVNIEP